MAENTATFHAQLIKNAQILFKYAFGISASRPRLGYMSAYASHRHIATEEDLKLTQAEEFYAPSLLEHVAIYILAVQIDTALKALVSQPVDETVQAAARIARLIRNAFAHNPFAPEWKISREDRNKQFAVAEIISIDTRNLNGKYVGQSDYGRPLALLKLSEFVMAKVMESK